MTSAEFDNFLAIARKHKVHAFECGDVKVTFSSMALVPEQERTNPTELQSVKDPEAAPKTIQGFSLDQVFRG